MKRLYIFPALALFVIAPTVGELLSGSSPPPEFFNPINFIILALLYGCGAIICRELVTRWHKGWASLLLLGIAYGIYKEGLVVRSFFDPNWPDLGSLASYGRVAGVNWVWVEHLTHYHALISIAASVALVEIIYPDRRGQPWVSQMGLVVNWIGFALMLLIGYGLTPYQPSLFAIYVTLLVVLGFGLAAYLLPARIIPPRQVSVPRPWRFWLLSLSGMFIYFFTVYIASDKNIMPFPALTILLVLIDILALWLVMRWSGNGTAWDDRHRLALTSGALTFFLLFIPLVLGQKIPSVYAVSIISLILLLLLARSVYRRPLSTI